MKQQKNEEAAVLAAFMRDHYGVVERPSWWRRLWNWLRGAKR